MTMKKVIALVLCVVMLMSTVAMLASCGEETPATTTTGKPATTTKAPEATTTTGAPTTTAPNGPQVTTADYNNINYTRPEKDLECAVISFVISDTDGDGFNYRSIFSDADTGEVVDQKIADRNADIEEHFNCTIVPYQDGMDNIHVSSVFGSEFLAGNEEIDIIAGRQWDDIQLALDGYLCDLEEYGEIINWKNKYWSTSYIDGMNYGNEHVYWLVGDLNLRFTGGFYTVFVNKTIYDTSCKAKYGDIYDLVYNGDWHYGTVMEMSALAYQDIGTEKDVIDLEDVLGIALPLWDNTNAMVISAGIPFGTENSDGSVTMNITDTNERLSTFLTTFGQVLGTRGVYTTNGNYAECMGLLAEDKALMVFGRLNQAQLYLTEMSSDYFILPYPKLDDTQERYYSSVHDGVAVYGIHANSADIEASAYVLEALAAASYQDVRPEYYEYALKFKYTRGDDDKPARMLDYIAACAYSDLVYVWCFNAKYSMTGVNLGALFRGYLSSNPAGATTQIRRLNKSWQKGTNQIIEEFEALWARS